MRSFLQHLLIESARFLPSLQSKVSCASACYSAGGGISAITPRQTLLMAPWLYGAPGPNFLLN